jgi:hypothetical protein
VYWRYRLKDLVSNVSLAERVSTDTKSSGKAA